MPGREQTLMSETPTPRPSHFCYLLFDMLLKLVLQILLNYLLFNCLSSPRTSFSALLSTIFPYETDISTVFRPFCFYTPHTSLLYFASSVVKSYTLLYCISPLQLYCISPFLFKHNSCPIRVVLKCYLETPAVAVLNTSAFVFSGYDILGALSKATYPLPPFLAIPWHIV